MSNVWIDLRGKVLLADLATTDPDVETLQVAPASMLFASPKTRDSPTADFEQEIMIQVRAYGALDESSIVAGTINLQVIELSPQPIQGSPLPKMYIGRTPVAAYPIFRGLPVSMRYVHGFTVRLDTPGGAAAAATHFRVFYRGFR